MRISDWSSDVCSSDLGLLERHPVDHRAAAMPGRHGVEDLGPRPQHANPGRAVKLVAGKDVEVAIEGGHVDRQARPRLAANETQDSEERRVGKEGASTCRSRWSPNH